FCIRSLQIPWTSARNPPCARRVWTAVKPRTAIRLRPRKPGEKGMIPRRTFLVAAAATATTSAFAQGQSSRTLTGTNPSSAEAQYIQQVMPLGSLSLALSRIAEQKAQFPKLKQFAQLEVAEQETVADVLKSLLNPGSLSGTVKPPTEAEV